MLFAGTGDKAGRRADLRVLLRAKVSFDLARWGYGRLFSGNGTLVPCSGSNPDRGHRESSSDVRLHSLPGSSEQDGSPGCQGLGSLRALPLSGALGTTNRRAGSAPGSRANAHGTDRCPDRNESASPWWTSRNCGGREPGGLFRSMLEAVFFQDLLILAAGLDRLQARIELAQQFPGTRIFSGNHQLVFLVAPKIFVREVELTQLGCI